MANPSSQVLHWCFSNAQPVSSWYSAVARQFSSRTRPMLCHCSNVSPQGTHQWFAAASAVVCWFSVGATGCRGISVQQDLPVFDYSTLKYFRQLTPSLFSILHGSISCLACFLVHKITKDEKGCKINSLSSWQS